jgi:DNA-binding transcriptional ArsR family regulator
MTARRRKMPEAEGSKKPYGFLLLLRGLAAAAIQLDRYPSALRVLCVAAEYMNADGVCRVGQDTIAARLGITRQAVGKHLAVLEDLGILDAYTAKDGILKTYSLSLEGLDEQRYRQGAVDARRKAKREARADSEREDETPDEAAQRRAGGIYFVWERSGWAAFGEAENAGADEAGCIAAMEAAERERGEEYREAEKRDDFPTYRLVYIDRPPLVVVPENGSPREPIFDDAPLSIRERVFHRKFGYGAVSSVEDNKIRVMFAAGEKVVVRSFLDRAPFQEPATSEVSGGAT